MRYTTRTLLQRWAVLSIVIFFFGPLFPGPSSVTLPVMAQTEPPANGDWVIADMTVKSHTSVFMNGNITVQNGGHLTLDHVDLTFNSTSGREFIFTVEQGGNLTIDNSTVNPVNTSWGYTLMIQGGAQIWNSEFYHGGRYLDPRTIKIYSDDVFITNNRFEDANGTSIMIFAGVAPRVYNNTILRGTTGLFFHDNTYGFPPVMAVAFNNTITDVEGNGIYIGNGNVPYVVANTIVNPGNRGIHIQYTNALVSYNWIRDAKNDAAIFLYGETHKPKPFIGNNTIEDCVMGFVASGPTEGVFENNTILRSTYRGVILQWSSKTLIKENMIEGTKGDGIVIKENADPLVFDNELKNNIYNIKLESRGKGTLTENHIQGGRFGIWSKQSSPEIINNRIHYQSDTGIYINDKHYSRDPLIMENKITNADIGIDIKKSSPLIKYNDISTTNTTGIHLFSTASPQIIDNNLTFNKNTGVTVENGSRPQISGNRFSFNLHGINLKGADILIENNVLEFNDFSIKCEDMDRSIFFNNTFRDSIFFDFVLRGESHPTVRSSPFNKSHVAADAGSSLMVEWSVDLRVVNAQGTRLVDTSVTFYDKDGHTVHYDKTEADGILPNFIITEAEVGYDGIEDFGPFKVELQRDDERNETIMEVQQDIDTTLQLNYLPILDLNQITVLEDEEDSISLLPYLHDPDGNISDLNITVSSEHITVDNEHKSISLFYDREINYEIVTFNISDGLTTVHQEVIVTVLPQDDMPTFNGRIPDAEVYEDVGWSVNLSKYFEDEEHKDELLYIPSHDQIEIDNATKMAYWKATTEIEGLWNVVIKALDIFGDHEVESNPFTLTLIPMNDGPIYKGGMKSVSVQEDMEWEIYLLDHFDDEENREELTFRSSDPRISIDPVNKTASWAPREGDATIVGLTFTAIDADDETLTAVSEPITLTFLSVDDPPVFLEACLEGLTTIIYSGQTWQLVLTDCFFDEEKDQLVFSSNYGSQIEIFQDSLGRVKAVWTPKDIGKDIELSNVTFYAYQLEGARRRAESSKLDITFRTNQTSDPPEPRTITIVEAIPLYVYASIPIAIIGTAVTFYVYRRIRYHKYSVQDIFLVFNDGRLITHLTGEGEAGSVDEDILASMLTAIQDFVKESFASREVSSLDEMKYGEMSVLIERGIFAYLSVVISGHVTVKLKDELKETLRNIERKYATDLEKWDGDSKKLAKIEVELDERIIEGQPKTIIDLLRSY